MKINSLILQECYFEFEKSSSLGSMAQSFAKGITKTRHFISPKKIYKKVVEKLKTPILKKQVKGFTQEFPTTTSAYRGIRRGVKAGGTAIKESVGTVGFIGVMGTGGTVASAFQPARPFLGGENG